MYIECKNLGKRLRRAQVLHDVNLRMESGKIYGLWGKNGCGKTMLMRAICGVLQPLKGTVIIDGKELGKELAFPPSAGILIENPAFLNGYTGYQNLKMLASIRGEASDEQICDTLHRIGLDPEDRRKYYKYSLGMKQRLGIACAVMERPDLILLDEPVNALDTDGVQEIRTILGEEKARGALIVVACHDRDEMRLLADEVFFMENGTIKEHLTDLSQF
jgi:ABC-2 type transport system ATP-binding protein